MRRTLRALVVLVLAVVGVMPVGVASADTVDVGSYGRSVAAGTDGRRVYVAVEDYGQGYGRPGIQIVDGVTRQVVKTVAIPRSTQSAVRKLTVSPDGRRVYVLTAWGVHVLDTATDTLGPEVLFPEQPLPPFPGWSRGQVTSLAVSPDGATIYLTQYGPSAYRGWRPGRVITMNADLVVTAIVDLATVPGNTLPVYEATISPDGRDVYVVTAVGLVRFDGRTTPPRIVRTVPGGYFHATFNADGRYVYAPDREDGYVNVVDTTTDTVVKRITVLPGYDYLIQPTLAHHGGALYVAEHGQQRRVAVIDTNTNQVVRWVTGVTSEGVYGFALSPDDRTVYVLGNAVTGRALLDVLPG